MLSLACIESPSPCFRASASSRNHLVPSRMLAEWDVLPAWVRLWDQGHRNTGHIISNKADLEKKTWNKGHPVNEILLDLVLPTTEIATKFNKLMLSINCPWKESTIRRKRYWKNKQTNKQKTKSTTNLLVFSQGFTSSKKRCVAFSEPRPQLDQETKVTLCNGGTPLPCLLRVMPPAPGHLSAVFWEKPVPDVQTETGAAEKRWSGWRATSSPFQLGRASLEKMAEFLMDWSVVCWKYASTD